MHKVLELDTECCWYGLGDRVRVTAPIDLGMYGTIDVDVKGTVAYVDAVTLYTEILLDTYHDGLREYRNHLWLIPPDTDDISDALELIGGLE